MKRGHPISQSKILSIVTILITISFLATTGLSQERFLMNTKERFEFKKASQFFANGKNLFEKKKYKKSLEYFNKCIKQLPFHADAYFYSSQIKYHSGNYPEALKLIEKAKNNFKKFANISTNSQMEQINQLREQKQSGQSTNNNIFLNPEIFQNQIPEIMEIPANYYYIHGNICIKQKKYTESYEQFLKAWEIDPGHGEALNNLATLNFMAKKYKEALYFVNMAESKKLKINKKLKESIVNSLKNTMKTKNQ